MAARHAQREMPKINQNLPRAKVTAEGRDEGAAVASPMAVDAAAAEGAEMRAVQSQSRCRRRCLKMQGWPSSAAAFPG